MARFFVDSNAAGANDGTSFTDAFASVTDLGTLTVGDDVLIASDHSESVTGNLTLGPANNAAGFVRFISVNSSTEQYEVGASITNTSQLRIGNVQSFGISYTVTTTINASTDQNSFQFYDCAISFQRFAGSTILSVMSVDTVYTFTSGISFASFPEGHYRFYGGSVTATQADSADEMIEANRLPFSWEMYGVDLSAVGCGSIIATGSFLRTGVNPIKLVGCRVPATFALYQNESRAGVTLINCFDGTTTVAPLGFEYEDVQSQVALTTAVTRTGGASDGETSYTMSLTAKADTTFKSLVAAASGETPIAVLVEPGDTNLRIYLAHNAVGSGTAGRLQTDECWARYLGPSEAGTADATLRYVDTRTEFGITPSDLTDDSSVWAGAGVGTVQRIDIAINPTEAGYAYVWLFFAPEDAADQTIHFDSKLDVT